MASRRSRPSPIQVVSSPTGYRIERPGARYAVERTGDEVRGAWLPEAAPLRGADDAFTEREARLLLPLLRDMEGMAAGKGGRPAAEPTTPDGRLVARACKKLGVSDEALAKLIGAADKTVISRVRNGGRNLPDAQRDTLRRLLASDSGQG